jgi:hypothetical protein
MVHLSLSFRRRPESSFVDVSQHRLGITRVSRIYRSFILIADCPHQIYTAECGIKTYRYHEANFSSQYFDFFEIKFNGWIIGCIIFEVPEQWA